MKTYAFIWAQTWVSSFEYEFVIAMAETREEARLLVKNQIEAEIANQKSIALFEAEKGNIPVLCIDYRLNEIESDLMQILEDVNKYEPSHIISNRMAMVIPHANE